MQDLQKYHSGEAARGDGLIVLAGGKSSRMGSDKWALPFGSETVLERILHTYSRSGLFREIWVVRSYRHSPEQVPEPEPEHEITLGSDQASVPIKMIRDEAPDIGPLGGILSALRRATSDRVLVTASDMPFPSPRLAERLLTLSRECGAMAVLPSWNGRLHPLHAVYRSACLPGLQAFVAGGGRKVMDWLAQTKMDILPEEAVKEADPEGRSLYNMNTPEDYASALKIMRSGGEAQIGSD